MSWLLTNFIAAFLLPPLSLLLPFALGLWLWHRRPRLARALLGATFALLWLLSTPIVSNALLQSLEGEPHTLDLARQPADAIVVLGGDTYFHAPEYGGQDTVGSATLERLRYAARLQRMTGKPILTTGGKPSGNAISEAAQMREVLEGEFGVPVRWIEDGSDNTSDNAFLSFRMLQREGMVRIYLITHAWHMPRAAGVFRRVGFEVVEAPTAFTTRYRTDALAFLPRAGALHDSNIYFHEIIGLLWYHVKLAFSNTSSKG